MASVYTQVACVVMAVLCVFFKCVPPIYAQQVMEATPAAEMKRLRTDILKNYDKMTRPGDNMFEVNHVKMFFDVRHLVALDEKFQTLTVRGQLMLSWTDRRLRWDSSSYSDLTKVKLQPTEIWVPDVHSIYNTKAVDMFSDKGAPVVVYSDGSVKWYPPAVFDIPCSADYRHYPFDSHQCFILFGAWTSDGNDIYLETIDMDSGSSSVDGTEWRLRRVTHKTEVLSDNFHVVRVLMDLERLSRMYRYICVLPTLSALVSSLFGFWLLPKDTARYLIGLSNIILTSLLLQYLAMTVPSGKDMPLIAQYSAACLCMSGVFVLVTIVTHLVGDRSGPVPQLILRLTQRPQLERYLCLLICEDNPSAMVTPSEEEKEKRKREWTRVSLVVDRMSFYAFSCVYVVLVGVLASI